MLFRPCIKQTYLKCCMREKISNTRRHMNQLPSINWQTHTFHTNIVRRSLTPARPTIYSNELGLLQFCIKTPKQTCILSVKLNFLHFLKALYLLSAIWFEALFCVCILLYVLSMRHTHSCSEIFLPSSTIFSRYVTFFPFFC